MKLLREAPSISAHPGRERGQRAEQRQVVRDGLAEPDARVDNQPRTREMPAASQAAMRASSKS